MCTANYFWNASNRSAIRFLIQIHLRHILKKDGLLWVPSKYQKVKNEIPCKWSISLRCDKESVIQIDIFLIPTVKMTLHAW